MLEPTDSHQIEHAIVSGILSSRDRHLERVGFGPGSIDEIQPLQIFYQNDWNPNKSLVESIPKEKKTSFDRKTYRLERAMLMK